MSAEASQVAGPEGATSWQISVQGWRTIVLDARTRPHLADGSAALHLWSADLDRPGTSPTGVLSHEDIERARRIVRPRARARWLAARVFVRGLLGAYLEQEPRSLLFAVEGRGKPVLDGLADDALHFNLSHSGSLALCALSRACAVGVDVQLIPRSLNIRWLAVRLLGTHDAAQLERLEPDERRLRLLSAWARLEAERKRTGLGLGAGGERFYEPRPWLAQLELTGAAGTGALALALPPSELFLGSWS